MKKAKGICFHPLLKTFPEAIHGFSSMREAIWKSKVKKSMFTRGGVGLKIKFKQHLGRFSLYDGF